MAGENKINSGDALVNIINSDSFLTLDTETKSKVIAAISSEKAKAGGLMGKLFGTKTETTAIYIGFALTVLLVMLLVAVIFWARTDGGSANMELINAIIPLITLAIGYTFGKGVS